MLFELTLPCLYTIDGNHHFYPYLAHKNCLLGWAFNENQSLPHSLEEAIVKICLAMIEWERIAWRKLRIRFGKSLVRNTRKVSEGHTIWKTILLLPFQELSEGSSVSLWEVKEDNPGSCNESVNTLHSQVPILVLILVFLGYVLAV